MKLTCIDQLGSAPHPQGAARPWGLLRRSIQRSLHVNADRNELQVSRLIEFADLSDRDMFSGFVLFAIFL